MSPEAKTKIMSLMGYIRNAHVTTNGNQHKAITESARQTIDDLYLMSGDVRRKMEKADKWFDRYGGWGKPSDDAPDNYDKRVDRYLEWLADYEAIRSAVRLGEAMLWPSR